MKILISISAAPSKELQNLKKEIKLRTQYEKLKDAIQKRKSSYLNADAARKKFADWKKENPKYPQVLLSVLQKRLNALVERADPKVKSARLEKGKQNALLKKQLSSAEKELSRLKDDLADANNKDYDYVPDDVDDVVKYKADLKKNIARTSQKVRTLRAKMTA
jgi:hypothetical protein